MLSTVVLTHNNKDTLSGTLKSVSFSDEVVVIDDFSTDDSVRIASEYTPAVYKRHLAGDFSAQRNFGLEKAKGDWILFVDSDEIVSSSLQKEIQDAISRQGTDGKGIAGYFLKRDDIFFGKKLRYGETKNVQFLRLSKKNEGVWKRPVHEYWDIRGTVRTLQNPLVHVSHTSVAQFITDINTYSTINAKYLYTKKTKSRVYAIIAYPLAKFIQNYMLRLGFLDGTSGAIMAIMMSFHSFLTRAKLSMLSEKH